MTMNNGTPGLFRLLTLVFCALPVLLFLGSCNNESPTMCPLTGVGALEGYLKVLGEGVSARIGARALEGSDPGAVVAYTESDSTGWYRLDLPTGLYRLEVDPPNSSSSTSDYYDSIRVLPRVFRFDIKRGRAEVRIGMPDDLEGARFTLSLHDDDARSMRESTNVEEGLLVFEFPALVPAAYTMELSGETLVNEYNLPVDPENPDGDEMVVGLAVAAVYEVDFSDSYASISGSITGSWQAPEWGGRQPELDLFSPEDEWVGRSNCQVDGSFICGFLRPQPVFIMSEIAGMKQWIGGETFGVARGFNLQAGDRITGVDQVESGIFVRLDGPGDLVIHQPSFMVRSENGEEHYPTIYWNSAFTINNLGPGRHFLYLEGYCRDEIWESQWYDGSEVPEGATAIDLAEGELQEISMDLVRGGRIEGNLLRSDGTRPRKILYGLFDSTGEPMCDLYFQWWQFDEGKYRFQGLADGEYFLGVQVSGDAIWWYPGSSEFSEAVPLTIENNGDLVDVDWMLP